MEGPTKQGDLRVRLLWELEHDRAGVVELLAVTAPSDVLREALAAQQATPVAQ